MTMKRTIDFHLNDQRKKTNLYQAIKNDLDNGSSTDEELFREHLPATLYPLSHYANDPKQLINELFSVVRGKRLARLIPPELKDMTFEELKADCLIQLLCMSKKRVLATLEGREMNSSSDSDDSVDYQREKKDETSHKRSHREKKTKLLKKKKVETESESEEKEGKTLLEILELEMKAKAIRALLGPNQKEDNNTQVEEAIKNEIIAEKIEESKSDDKSWSERYEEREDVKEVVKTSRLCTNMRRRMLLHQQKMLADRAKAKVEETERIKTEGTVKSKLVEKLPNASFKNDEKQSNVNLLEKIDVIKIPGDCETFENINDKLLSTKNVHEGAKDTFKNNNKAISSNVPVNACNTSTDDDSQKSTDFELVLNEYTQKNSNLEITINEYSQKNTDLKEEINECSKRNDVMENTMNICAQKNSDIETAINNYSVENNNVDESIAKECEENDATGECTKNISGLNSLIIQSSKKNVDLKALVKEYSKRNSDILSLIGEYSQNNVDIQSVIGDYTEGNLKLETIIDEYSHRNAKINTMINEYSVNNSYVEKIINRNNRKQLLIDKYIKTGKSIDIDTAEEKSEPTDTICKLNTSTNLNTEINCTLLEKPEKDNKGDVIESI
ncbi:Hypothetical protein CINCED_3A015265 [Cinara cedri]|uniref:Uncharacterized protein n=2 Tax=Cinara cedri TaxID=506608 RepID=A0A5E4MR03_9HEMI|nr:Hypothetical protein CINCED_3A015265 [Cinara cedri]